MCRRWNNHVALTMSDLSLFSSDDDLAQEQRSARRHGERSLSLAEQALTDITDAREIRLHRRIRAFAWWLFILPVVAWGLFVLVMYLVGQSLLPGR